MNKSKLIVILLFMFACKSNSENDDNSKKTINKEDTEMAISNSYRIRYTSQSDILNAKKFLTRKVYEMPNNKVFRSKIIEKFKIDIDTIDAKIKDSIIYEEAILDTQVSIDAIMYPVAYRGNKFLTPLVEDMIEDFFSDRTRFENFPQERKEIFYHFNNWIFNDAKASFAYLKSKKPWTFMYMIHDYAYTDNDEYTNFILKNLGEEREAQEDINEMVMGWVAEEKRYGLRKNVVEKIVELQPDFVFNIGMIVSDFEEYTVKSKELNQFYSYETKEQKLEDFSYLMNALVDQGMVGILDELYNENPMILGLLKKHDFYGHKSLKEYSLKAYGQTPYDEENPKPVYDMAVINDPDGYTNVRDKSGEVIFKITDGEEFMVSKSKKEIIGEFYKEGWWYVSFKGEKGWIHKSRVTIIQE